MRVVFSIVCAITLAAASLSNRAGILAIFRLPMGDVEVELFDANKPVTVQNFVRYVQTGYTNNMLIHRWEPRFVIQGGGYYTANRGQTNAILKELTTYGEITNEFGVGRRFSNTYGTLAMARKPGQTNSATSQWFFNLTNSASLDQRDGGFTVFGKVIRGTNILERFNDPSTNSGGYWINVGAPLTSVPVLAFRPTYDDLVYVDISLLTVYVTRTPAGPPEISWRSVSNAVNRIEFTTLFSAAWTELISTNGTGEFMGIVDAQAGTSDRIYRVRVDY